LSVQPLLSFTRGIPRPLPFFPTPVFFFGRLFPAQFGPGPYSSMLFYCPLFRFCQGPFETSHPPPVALPRACQHPQTQSFSPLAPHTFGLPRKLLSGVKLLRTGPAPTVPCALFFSTFSVHCRVFFWCLRQCFCFSALFLFADFLLRVSGLHHLTPLFSPFVARFFSLCFFFSNLCWSVKPVR